MNLDKIWDYKLRRAFTAWDLSTTYSCDMQNVPYNQEKQEKLKQIWDALVEEHSQYCLQKNPKPPKIQRPSQEKI